MAGRGFRGGGFRGGRSFGGRSRRSYRRGSSSGSRKFSKSRTGKSSQNKAVVYSIYDSRGNRTYVGTTNNPGRRATEHARSGKLTKRGKFVVESKRTARKSAERLEARKIQGYRSRTGRLPKHNKTPDGQYRFWD